MSTTQVVEISVLQVNYRQLSLRKQRAFRAATNDVRAHNFQTDDATSDLGSAWLKICCNQSGALPRSW